MASSVQVIASKERDDLSYFEVPSGIYRPGDLLDRDVYILYQGQYIVYRGKDQRWTLDDVEKLKGFEITNLYVRCPDDISLASFLDQRISQVIEDPKASQSHKAQILYHASVSAMQAVYRQPQSIESVQQSIGFVKHCISFLSRDPKGFIELMRLASKNFSEYSHAIHVAAYSINLGKFLGYRSSSDLLAIGVGALLHDIGKSKIDKKLIEKPGKLDPAELAEMKKHPVYGYEMLASNRAVPDLSRLIVLQHHERANSRGYPNQSGTDLHIFSKIVGITDVFDALTSDRPYQKARAPYDAVRFMLETLKGDFEQTVLINLIRMLRE